MSQATSNQQNTLAKRAPPPAFDPERPMLVQPWREFEGRGWLEVQYLGGSITRTVKCKLLGALLTEAQRTNGTEVFVGPQEAKDIIIRNGLWSPKERGSKKAAGKVAIIELPKRSIVKKDFEGNDESLAVRVRSVASNLGERTAAGRIGSMELSLQGADTFSKWWNAANSDQKARLLTDKKHYDTLVRADKTRLAGLIEECPFRSNEPVPAKAEEEEDDEPKPRKAKLIIPLPAEVGESSKGKEKQKQKKPAPTK